MLDFIGRFLKNVLIGNPLYKNEVLYNRLICPYCECELDKAPNNKRKCPRCKNTIYVRTSPYTKNKLLVTEQQAIKIKDIKQEIAKQNWIKGRCYNHKISRSLFNERKKRIQSKFSKEPDDYDVLWSLLNEKALEYARSNKWGSYTIITMHMADLLYRENSFVGSLKLYLHVCYLDLNGPIDMEDFGEKDFKRCPPFNIKRGFLAPYSIDRIYSISTNMELGLTSLELMFMDYNSKNKIPHTPLTPHKAWPKLKETLLELYS